MSTVPSALQPSYEIEKHALAKVIGFTKPSPPKWVIPHFIAEGVVLIAGGHGVGKTTAILPLAMAAAGLHLPGYELAPKHWRSVIYVTEDTEQAKRIVAGYSEAIGKSLEAINKRVHLVAALRMSVDAVVNVADYYRDYIRTITLENGQQVDIPPLVVFDTMAAVFQLENENDNAEASELVAAVKQRFEGLPVWIVSHVSKGNLTLDGAKSGAPTARGASAFEADANQVLYIVKEEKSPKRWLVRGKTRFEAKWPELEIITGHGDIKAHNEFGEEEELILRWGVAQPPAKTREEAAKEAKEEQEKAAAEQYKVMVLVELQRAHHIGEPHNRNSLHSTVKGDKQTLLRRIDEYMEDGLLIEVLVPREKRHHHQRSNYLVPLEPEAAAALMECGEVPQELLKVPASWLKEDAGEVFGSLVSPHAKPPKSSV